MIIFIIWQILLEFNHKNVLIGWKQWLRKYHLHPFYEIILCFYLKKFISRRQNYAHVHVKNSDTNV